MHAPRSSSLRTWSCLAALLALFHGGALAADEPAPAPWRLSGYGTLGWIDSSATEPWGYRRDFTQPAKSPDSPQPIVDSRVGLQLNWRLSPQWETLAQAVVRGRGGNRKAAESLEWAFVSYRPFADVHIRVGRTSPDVFLLADHRNVGFAYPWVRPPVEFYGWMPVYSTDGADLACAWQNGDTTWRVKAFAGRNRLTLAATAGYPDMQLRGYRLAGSSVAREQGGLTLKLSFARGRYAVRGAPILDDLGAGLATARAVPVPQVAQEAARLAGRTPYDDFSIRYMAFGAAWKSSGPWLLQGEVARLGGSLEPGNGWHAYASVGFRQGRWTLFATAARTRPLSPSEPSPEWEAALAPVLGPDSAALLDAVGKGAAQAFNLTRRDQRTTALGLRWDASATLSLKAQVERVSVFANGSALWADSTEAPARAKVLSLALDFVF